MIRKRILTLCTLLGVFFTVLTIAPAQATNRGECGSAFSASGASKSCYYVYSGVYYDSHHEKCRVMVRCHRVERRNQARMNNILVTVAQARQLNNCNGYLKIGSC